MTERRRQYQSYLLRCWSETDSVSDIVIWRFSLQDIHNDQRCGFANLTELVIALQEKLIENLSSETIDQRVKNKESML